MKTGELSRDELINISAAFGVPTHVLQVAAEQMVHVFEGFRYIEPYSNMWAAHSTPTLDKHFFNVCMRASDIWKVEQGYRRVSEYFDEVRQQEKDRKRHCIR